MPKLVLFEQLDRSLASREIEKVDKILANIKLEDLPELEAKPCILGRQRSYMTSNRVFMPSTLLKLHSLAPFLDEVDGEFALKHPKLLATLAIKPQPSIEDLQYVQSSLDSSSGGQLNEIDLGVVIATLEVATRLEYPSVNFLIPDRTSTLRALTDIVHGDPNVNGGIADLNFTHTRISEDLITRLGVENSFAYATRNEINIEDEDEDEYTPREKLSTVVADTLGRYPIETTFSEFLANADDAGATKISWTIDGCDEGPHASQSLLTKELAEYQGAALFAYNDGVFSEQDYAGFKDIGQGGKVEDATTTGMFGRGALSMYHFTDLPMLISGGFYVALDPQQRCLTRNRRWNRKVGVKIALSTARRVAGDQLAPFYGLHGFDKNCDYYRGTIFRLPFRAPSKQTLLKTSPLHADSRATQRLLEDYFDTARISLLFLHNVTNVHFCIRGEETPAWSVSAQRPEDSADDVFQKVTVRSVKRRYEPVTDVWHVGITDIEHSPPGVVRLGKGSSKITERGIAACLQQGELLFHKDDKNTVHKPALADNGEAKSSRVGPSIFCRLPIASESQLPVSFHASFAITGDRKTIAFEDRSESADWNHWLLTESIPRFYLEFLKDLSSRLGDEAFKFWPSKLSAGKRSNLSVAVANGFWTKVMDQEHVDLQIYPSIDHGDSALAAGANDLRRKKQRKTRKLHVVTSLSNSRFDFLPCSASSKLRPLFGALQVDLVRPPQRLWDALRNAASGGRLVELGPAYLAELFKQENNCVALEIFIAQIKDEVNKSEAMAMLLKTLVPCSTDRVQTSISIVQGCRVLPRPFFNSPFGMLRPKGEGDSKDHLVPTLKEQELFAFASDSLVNITLSPRSIIKLEGEEISRRFRNPITEIMDAQFNVRKLAFGDLGPLLGHPQSPIALAGAGKDRDEWVPKLWTYINTKFQALKSGADRDPSGMVTLEQLLSEANLWDQAIYRFSSQQQWCYITPRQFAAGPCIVDPEPDEQKELCALIPDLKCLDRACLPDFLVEDEGQLKNVASFQRFLKCLKTIEHSTDMKVKPILDTVLTRGARETLRELLICFLGNCVKSDVVCDKAVLQHLPVWPRLKRPEQSSLGYIAAEDARFCIHSELFMPWIKDLSMFVEPEVVRSVQISLPELGCHTMTAEQFWHYTKGDLPPAIALGASMQQYVRLVQYLAAHLITPSGNVAPNGSGALCKANTLYDHDDTIFKAAFRGEDSARFLHPDMRHLRSFWVSAGLRARPATRVMSSEDYLQCTLAIDQQWTPNTSDHVFKQDAETVSAYLSFDRPDFRTWPQSTWDQISKVRMFHVEEHHLDQRPYRQPRMRELAQEHTHCALINAGRTAHIRISWSQVKFLKNPAATAVFDKLPNGGLPSTALVYRHLQGVIGNCKHVSQRDLEDYLRDVQACYTHLQDSADTKSLLPGIRDARIWFNLDVTQLDKILKQQLEDSLTTAKLLCLNSPGKKILPHSAQDYC